MKKVTLFIVAAFFFSVATFAKIRVVQVANFQFTPASMNVHVGDTIKFVWVSGSHTTTSTVVPTGAKMWDDSINNTKKKFKTFKYIVKKAGTYNYFCRIHGSFMSATFNATVALDPGLDDFTVSETDDANAVLNWNVLSGNNVQYFSVQKSTDGKKFTEVARVQPSVGNAYHYTDNNNTGEKFVYYQVQMTDKKGNKDVTDIKVFAQQQKINKLITSISPNPVSRPGHLMLQFNADTDGSMLVQLFDGAGKQILQDDFSATKGLNNGHFHLGDIPPGTYYLVCTLGKLQEKHTIIVK